MFGFTSYASQAYNGGKLSFTYEGVNFSIDKLRESPELSLEWGNGQGNTNSPTLMLNNEIFDKSHCLYVHSQREKDYFARRLPRTKTEMVRWAPGIVEGGFVENDDSFLRLTGLTKGEYVLSVGRFEGRKNQLASLLALYNSDLPMAFISPTVYSQEFVEKIIEIAATRKGPTIIVSQDQPSEKVGNATIIGTDGGLLKDSVVQSAYENAGLHLHPSFYEMPGLTYLEAAHYNIPQVASTWTSIDEYFALGGDKTLEGRVEYVDPDNLNEIEAATIKQFGRKFDTMDPHRALTRTNMDVANDILKVIQ